MDFGDFRFWILDFGDLGFWILGILDFGEFGFWILGPESQIQNPKSPKSKILNPKSPKSGQKKLGFWILGILGFGDFGFWDFGDFGFWIVGILDFGFWDFGDFGFWILGILDFGFSGFWGFWILGFLEHYVADLYVQSLDFGIWGFWILDFGDFWILGILDFGFWGSWILDFGLGILDGHLVTKFWMLHKKRRLCTPNRVGGFMYIYIYTIYYTIHNIYICLMFHFVHVLLMAGPIFQAVFSHLWYQTKKQQQKHGRNYQPVAGWNQMNFPSTSPYTCKEKGTVEGESSPMHNHLR